jgi:predicted lipopolysaccharide heptosyltransferase III
MEGDEAQPLAHARWDWASVRKVLLIRLRSIGDTVLSTPSLFALKRFLPHAEIDILVEDWVAPVLDQHPHVDNVVVLERRGGFPARARTARQIRSAGYDVVYNLHGGTTATFLTRATGARHRVGYKTYQYAQLHNHQAPPSSLLWGEPKTHSVEQQLALPGWTGVPVSDRPRTHLAVTDKAASSVARLLAEAGVDRAIALIHPAAAFATKQWATANFARVAEFVSERGFAPVAIAGPNEQEIIKTLSDAASVPIVSLDLSLPEVAALAARSQIFIGNDSGIAHIAAAVGTPSVVIFGSSNIAHWSPWNKAAAEVVYEAMPCQPCHGYHCEKFPQPECILRVPVDRVVTAIDKVLGQLTDAN